MVPTKDSWKSSYRIMTQPFRTTIWMATHFLSWGELLISFSILLFLFFEPKLKKSGIWVGQFSISIVVWISEFGQRTAEALTTNGTVSLAVPHRYSCLTTITKFDHETIHKKTCWYTLCAWSKEQDHIIGCVLVNHALQTDRLFLDRLKVFPEAWTAILISLDNSGIWNLRTQNLNSWYLGQEVYISVVNPEADNSEISLPENAIFCGILSSLQK